MRHFLLNRYKEFLKNLHFDEIEEDFIWCLCREKHHCEDSPNFIEHEKKMSETLKRILIAKRVGIDDFIIPMLCISMNEISILYLNISASRLFISGYLNQNLLLVMNNKDAA